MNALHIVDTLHTAGLRMSLIPGGALAVAPASRITHELRRLIRDSKAMLVDWLQAANDPAPEPPADPNAWRELAQAYHDHHTACPVCTAAGRGSMYGLRCGVGAALWNSYQNI